MTTTLRCHRVSQKDAHIKTIYLEELEYANLLAKPQLARLQVGDRVVISAKVKRCPNPVDLAFRVNRNGKTLSTTAWHPALGEPECGHRATRVQGQPVVLQVVDCQVCAR